MAVYVTKPQRFKQLTHVFFYQFQKCNEVFCQKTKDNLTVRSDIAPSVEQLGSAALYILCGQKLSRNFGRSLPNVYTEFPLFCCKLFREPGLKSRDYDIWNDISFGATTSLIFLH